MKAYITADVWEEELVERFGSSAGAIVELSDDTKTFLTQVESFWEVYS